MDKLSIIRALRVGVSEASNLLEYLVDKHGDQEPAVGRVIHELKTLLDYSAHAYDDLPEGAHQPYDN